MKWRCLYCVSMLFNKARPQSNNDACILKPIVGTINKLIPKKVLFSLSGKRADATTSDFAINTCRLCCGLAFPNQDSLLKHSMENHQVAICGLCGKTFKSKSGYNYHMKLMHGSTSAGEVHFCPICGKSFQGPSFVKRHLRCHSDDRPYTCRVCYRTFRFKESWKRHESSHLSVQENDKDPPQWYLFPVA